MNYKDILFATTRILSENFNCDIFVESSNVNYENECFVVDIVPIGSEAITRQSNEKSLMVSIKYFSDSVLDHYDVADRLEMLFARNINVNNTVIYVSKLEPVFLSDDVGEYLDFLVYTSVVNEMIEDSASGEYPPIDGDIDITVPIEQMNDINIK